jgi:hypothetical protein
MSARVLMSLLAALGGSTTASPAPAGAPALTARFHAGERYANVFSRTIAIHADGFEDSVRRVSGSAQYRVLDGSAPQPRLRIDYRYDGLQQGNGTVELREQGAVSCFNGSCAPNTDASGLAWKPHLWGTAPARLQVGQHWEVSLPTPWELGTPGRQTVTVVALDRAGQRVTLEREGSGEGAYLGDRLDTTLVREGHSYPVHLLPGRSHWRGYTTFHAGVVVSDELVVERAVTLVSPTLGRVAGQEREYILLNAMPATGGAD